MTDSALLTTGLPIALAIIVFGLGLSLTPNRFRRVARTPKAVAIALVLQVLVLPLVAFGLLAKGAEDVKSGAGQYFTPRALISAMVDCVQPTAADTVADPACGTGGFLLEAYRHATDGPLTPDDRERLRAGFVHGTELVDGTARLAAMNMVLHGIVQPGDASPIEVRDALLRADGRHPGVVLANPPFGRKSSITMVGADGREAREDTEVTRADFWVTTSNKQLNFVQHIAQMLAISGRAAVVLPDNVLFEGGAGETVRRRLLADYDVHTLLRLPTGIFYAGGVKANVLFFDKKPARPGQPWTDRLWVYDLRINQHFTQKQNPLRRHHLDVREPAQPTRSAGVSVTGKGSSTGCVCPARTCATCS